MFQATLIIRNRPPGYADTDDEYMHTDEAPIEEQMADFKKICAENICTSAKLRYSLSK